MRWAIVILSGCLLIGGATLGCIDVPSDPVVTIDPETGLATVKVPEWKPSVAETVKQGAEIGLDAIETILLGGGSAASVLAALFGIKKGVKAKQAANEKKKQALVEEIAKYNATNGNGNASG